MKLLILGAGGHGRVIADAARESGKWDEIAFVDDEYPKVDMSGGWQVVGPISKLTELRESWDSLVVGIGNNQLRLELQQQASSIGFSIATVIHPSAQIASEVDIGEGSVVFANAVINTGSTLGVAVIINTSATVDHDNIIGDGAHISPGAHLAGNVKAGDYSWVGIGASVINGITIGSGATVGAGATVIKDVKESQTVVGVPAKSIL